MKKKIVPASVIFSAVLLIVVSSCVDIKYDLNKLNKYNIFSPNGIVVPVGSVDTVFLKKILENEAIDSLYMDEKGNYYFSCSGNYSFDLPKKEEFLLHPKRSVQFIYDDFSHLQEITIPLMWDSIVLIPKGEVKYSLDLPAIKKDWGTAIIDSCEFDTLPAFISLELIDIAASQENMELVLEITFSEAFTVWENPTYLTFNPIDCISGKTVSQAIFIFKYNFTSSAGKINYKLTLKKTKGEMEEIKFGNNPQIIVNFFIPEMNDEEGNIIYIGKVYGKINVNTSFFETFNTSFFKSLFPEGKLSFYNPSIQLKTTGNVGVPLDATLHFSGKSKDAAIPETTVSTSFLLEAPSIEDNGKPKNNFYYFAPRNEDIPDGATYKPFNFNPIIQAKPDTVRYELEIVTNTTDKVHFVDFHEQPAMDVAYQIQVPFAFDKDMALTFSDTIANVFDEDLLDILFYDSSYSGDIIIIAEVENTLPLDFELNTAILDENYSVLDEIVIEPIELRGDQKEFEFRIKNQYFGLIQKAKHIKISFTVGVNDAAMGNEETKGLNVNDYILIKDLIFEKTGGIHFKL
ncbi:MAG: DUF4621 domain-containing protein [Dysgonamonadaceae bacterium]|jgi:hypothetical protein|nr:DUF4621 domain-containing protein [Dysgonamonadaceae bacterium]